MRDGDAFGRPVRLGWRKRRWRCPEPLCAVATWSETSAAIAMRAVLTDRAGAAAARRVGRNSDSVAEVRAYGTGWHTIMRQVRKHGQPRIDDPARTAFVAALGMDETALAARHPRPPHLVRGRAGGHRHRLAAGCHGRPHRQR